MTTRRLAALAAAISLALCSAPPAGADPTTDPTAEPTAESAAERPAADSSTTLSLPDLGTSGTIVFSRLDRDNAQSSVTFPVPAGLVPVALKGTIELPVNLRFGNVSANQADRTLSRVGLPPQDGAEVDIPLPGVQSPAGVATVNLKMAAIAMDPYCWNGESPIRIANAAVVFAGAEAAPRSVAEFLSPALRRVVIAMPANPSAAESTAAVRVAAGVARRNSQRLIIDVIPLPAGRTSVDVPPGPLTRVIVVKEGPEKGLSLQNGGVPTLLVSGQGDDLPAQAQLVGNDVVRFAAGSRSVSGPLLEDRLLGLDTTLKEMNNSGITGQSVVVMDIDQTKFGEPLHNIRVHFLGSYTPLPSNTGGDVTVSLGGEIIDRWPTAPDGVIDRTVAVPDRLLDRVVGLQVAVRTAGGETDCTRVSTALRIDGTTRIQAEGANPPIPQGFQSIPQALMPSITVGIGPDGFADTARAVRIIAALQRISDVPLMTTVTDLKDAIAAGGSAVLIASGGWDDPSLLLPFNVNRNEITVTGIDPKGQSITLTLEPENRFASLQTVFEGRRSMLVATSNGAPAQLDGLLDWLAAERGRWAELNGQALIATQNGDPVTVPNPPVGQSVSSAPALVRTGHSPVIVVAIAAAVGAAVAAFVAFRRRRL